MAIATCRECAKEVSTEAKVCPHCGVDRPARAEPSAAQKIAGAVIVFGVIGAIIYAFATNSEPGQDPAKCLSDLQCAGDKFAIVASANCQQILEGQAKALSAWDHKIGDSAFRPIFSEFRWAGLDKQQIVYLGDQAKFQNQYGAWQRVPYRCTFDIKSGKPVSAEFVVDH